MEMTEIDQRLELIHFRADHRWRRAPHPSLRGARYVSDIRRQVRILDGEIHLGRKIIDAVVAEAELSGEFLDRHELNRRTPRLARCGILRATSRNVPAFAGRFGVKNTPTCNW